MNTVNSALFSLAMIAAAATAAPSAFAAMKVSDADHKMMSSCMAMSSDAMMKDARCVAMMKKSRTSENDMKTIISCRGMAKDAQAKDKACASMTRMHPIMMKMEMAR